MAKIAPASVSNLPAKIGKAKTSNPLDNVTRAEFNSYKTELFKKMDKISDTLVNLLEFKKDKINTDYETKMETEASTTQAKTSMFGGGRGRLKRLKGAAPALAAGAGALAAIVAPIVITFISDLFDSAKKMFGFGDSDSAEKIDVDMKEVLDETKSLTDDAEDIKNSVDELNPLSSADNKPHDSGSAAGTPTQTAASPAATPAASPVKSGSSPGPENRTSSADPVKTKSTLSSSETKDNSTPSDIGANGEFKSKEDFLKTMYPLAVEASKKLGGVDPNALLTQWGLESAWGKKTSGKYNYFGIKADKSWTGNKKDVMTHEVLKGERVNLSQPFRSYNSPKEAVDDYVNFLKTNKRYEKAGVFQAKTSGEYFSALWRAGYATDPNYAAKLTNMSSVTAKQTAALSLPPSTQNANQVTSIDASQTSISNTKSSNKSMSVTLPLKARNPDPTIAVHDELSSRATT